MVGVESKARHVREFWQVPGVSRNLPRLQGLGLRSRDPIRLSNDLFLKPAGSNFLGSNPYACLG